MVKCTWGEFIGRTILAVDDSCENQTIFTFTDGTSVTVEVEAIIGSLGLYGMTPYLDPSDMSNEEQEARGING